ncbi:hypothetical protein C8F04DRAFT_325618 [Mycena alexandri]|uniref:MYND-type domain-containing protein n=1 Tax=Mycena alexandri TaxID=1745969 RepID=A0AAD6S3L4_9AGAR|nr:hypothetical protein C8F04DRAFT_325618 [Mycena alexandri]
MASDLGLQMFHDGPVSHSHQSCGNCFQRSHGQKLFVCGGCKEVKYCSKKCQLSHYPAHKKTCKAATKTRLAIEEATQLPSATTDFHDWMEYYNMPLQNCAIAAMQLPKSPHLEQRVFIVLLRHKRDLSQPVWNKFEVVNIGMYHLNEVPHLEICSYEQSCARGKIQLGASFFGVIRSVFLVCLEKNGQTPNIVNVRELPIDHEMASARPLREDWWLLLREYINTGAKMRFCCGKDPHSRI